MENISNIMLYNDGELELKVSLNEETIWLRQDEISLLFNVDRTSVTRHINKILQDNEVEENSNVQKMHFANSDKPVKIYSLDISTQYFTLEVKITKNFHDRFLICDETVYHFGASFKDLGNKIFAVNKMNILVNDLLKNI